ncbi:MAG: 2Fe-2S iron-sulfur cluster binding domain-containing protein [Sphingomonas sp.]|nr:2Fe-2S iron-sulfur cluster binding domain-containing protein [Sphingomonas sp.]
MAEHFHALEIAEIVPETDEAVSIRFHIPPALEDAFSFKAGQHLTLKADIEGAEVRRNYSLCTAPGDKDVMVTVKRIAGGLFSNWAGDNLKAGDTLDVMAPHGSFTVPFAQGSAKRYVGFAGGSGITPIISLIRTALSAETGSRFTLFYGNRDSVSVIFLDALADLKDRFMSRFELYHFLAEEEQDIELFNGMLDQATCAAAIDQLVDDPVSVDEWFICGPGPMMDSAEAAILERKVDKARVHIERFTVGRPSAAVAAALQQAQAEAAGLSVSVTLDGRTRKVEFNGENILDSALEAGLSAPFACKAGVCATCRAKVIRGKVEMAVHYGLSDEEVAAAYVLTCQSVPVGDGVAVDYDS